MKVGPGSLIVGIPVVFSVSDIAFSLLSPVCSASLTTPDIKWLGVRPSDLDKYKVRGKREVARGEIITSVLYSSHRIYV